jgi:hypothetical protein
VLTLENADFRERLLQTNRSLDPYNAVAVSAADHWSDADRGKVEEGSAIFSPGLWQSRIPSDHQVSGGK